MYIGCLYVYEYRDLTWRPKGRGERGGEVRVNSRVRVSEAIISFSKKATFFHLHPLLYISAHIFSSYFCFVYVCVCVCVCVSVDLDGMGVKGNQICMCCYTQIYTASTWRC